jgi:hypothetical protein
MANTAMETFVANRNAVNHANYLAAVPAWKISYAETQQFLYANPTAPIPTPDPPPQEEIDSWNETTQSMDAQFVTHEAPLPPFQRAPVASAGGSASTLGGIVSVTPQTGESDSTVLRRVDANVTKLLKALGIS